MKTGVWIFYKNEYWNVYKVNNNTVLLHPETDDGFSNGSIIEVNKNAALVKIAEQEKLTP